MAEGCRGARIGRWQVGWLVRASWCRCCVWEGMGDSHLSCPSCATLRSSSSVCSGGRPVSWPAFIWFARKQLCIRMKCVHAMGSSAIYGQIPYFGARSFPCPAPLLCTLSVSLFLLPGLRPVGIETKFGCFGLLHRALTALPLQEFIIWCRSGM